MVDIQKQLHALFTRVATIIEENADDCCDDFIDIEVEPIVGRFIREHYDDILRGGILLFLMVWFAQWRAQSGRWNPAILRQAREYGGSIPKEERCDE